MAVVVVDETEGVVGEFGGEAEGVVASAGAGGSGGLSLLFRETISVRPLYNKSKKTSLKPYHTARVRASNNRGTLSIDRIV